MMDETAFNLGEKKKCKRGLSPSQLAKLKKLTAKTEATQLEKALKALRIIRKWADHEFENGDGIMLEPASIIQLCDEALQQ